MKTLVITAVIAGQIGLAAQPALAATIEDQRASQQQVGTFAGARLRLTLGGEKAARPGLGLGVAGVTQSRAPDGETRMHFSDGVQLGYSSDRRLGLMVAGKSLKAHKAALQSDQEDDDGDGISTLGWVGIIAGGVLIVGGIGVALLADAMNDASE